MVHAPPAPVAAHHWPKPAEHSADPSMGLWNEGYLCGLLHEVLQGLLLEGLLAGSIKSYYQG